MDERTIELEIPLLLPGLQDEADGCLARLETALQAQKGLTRAHLERERRPVTLCLHYDPDSLSLADVKRLAQGAGAEILDRFHHLLLPIEGMDCSDCVDVIEHSLGRIEGVLAVGVSYPMETVRVEFDARTTGRHAIEKRIRSLGYTIPASATEQRFQENRELLLTLLSGVLLVAGWAGEAFFGAPRGLAVLSFLAVYALSGSHIARHAWHSLRERRFDTDILMVSAAVGAAILGRWAEGALLLFLMSLAHALEERALDRARSAIRGLADLAPRTALVRRNGREVELPIEQISLGDLVIVRPGARMPVDGDIVEGESAVDQSPVTGESIPVDKVPGEAVFAGSVNGQGALGVKVTRLAKDSTLARVMKMVEEAPTQKSPIQNTVERFEGIFVPGVLIVTALVMVVPPLLGVPFQSSFLRAMTLLVAASPCALALGTPAAILAGIAQAARNGVLIKGGVHLENLGRLKAIAFDKTGTLTQGRPEVTDVLSLSDPQGQTLNADALLALAAAAESRSGHPLAEAVMRSARAKGLALPPVGMVESLTGSGLRASVNGQAVLIGNRKLMQGERVTLPAEAEKQIEAFQSSGKTTMLVAVEGRLAGVLAVADSLRTDAITAIQEMRRIGVRQTVLLTGDNPRVAAAIARQVGLTTVRAELLPQDKAMAVQALTSEFGPTGMVGDGVNDAPALANATVGIAMGGAATDVALETADVALMANDLSKLPFAIGLGRATRAVVLQNLVLSISAVGLLILAALTGVIGIGAAVVGHESVTLIVVFNALRLLGYRAPARV